MVASMPCELAVRLAASENEKCKTERRLAISQMDNFPESPRLHEQRKVARR
jgi:hypothetical protein